MKNRIGFLIIAALGICLQPLAAQTTHSIEDMEQAIALQTEKVKALSREFLSMNEKIEERIQSVVEALAAMEDSTESKTRITRLKSGLIDDLKKSVHGLQQHRSANAAALAQMPEFLRENADQAKTNEFLGEKMKARVDQIMTLASSLHVDEHVQKYEYYVREEYDGDVEVKKRHSEQYQQNWNKTNRANKSREDLIKNIEAEEYRLTQKINHINSELGGADPEALPALQKAELKQLQEFLDILADKKEQILAGKTMQTRPVGDTKDAMNVEHQLKQAMQDLRAANNQLRQKGIQLRDELGRLRAQQQMLKRAKAESEPDA